MAISERLLYSFFNEPAVTRLARITVAFTGNQALDIDDVGAIFLVEPRLVLILLVPHVAFFLIEDHRVAF